MIEYAIALFSILASIITAYFTATYARRKEEAHGQYRLVDIARRYLLNLINSFDGNGKTIKTQAAFDAYVAELEAIVRHLDELLGNAYVGELLVEDPHISKFLIQIRRELVEQKEIGRMEKFNPGSIGTVVDLFERLDGKLSLKSDIDDETRTLIAWLKDTQLYPETTKHH